MCPMIPLGQTVVHGTRASSVRLRMHNDSVGSGHSGALCVFGCGLLCRFTHIIEVVHLRRVEPCCVNAPAGHPRLGTRTHEGMWGLPLPRVALLRHCCLGGM